jgi:hypothetical protein
MLGLAPIIISIRRTNNAQVTVFHASNILLRYLCLSNGPEVSDSGTTRPIPHASISMLPCALASMYTGLYLCWPGLARLSTPAGCDAGLDFVY